MSRRRKDVSHTTPAPPPRDADAGPDTERPPELLDTTGESAPAPPIPPDPESTLDLRGDDLAAMMAGRDDLASEVEARISERDPAPARTDEPVVNASIDDEPSIVDAVTGDEHTDQRSDESAERLPGEGTETFSDGETAASAVSRAHLMGLLEALIFASDKPIKTNELAKAASATLKETRVLLVELKSDFASRGVQLDEVAGGWIFRTNPQYAPFVRDLTKSKPVRLSRAQVETLAILAYRQPITRPEVDDIRGVDCGAVLKLLLERDLVKILGKKDEPGRPLLYGTTAAFLEFFGLKSLKDLPTLREFTELNEDSRRVVEQELGDVLDERQPDMQSPHSEPTEARVALPPEAFEDPEPNTAPTPGEDSPTDPPTLDGMPIAEAIEADDGEASDTAAEENDENVEPADSDEKTTPPVRVPGAWELAADGEEEDEDDDDDDDDDDDEDDDDDDDEDDEDEDDEVDDSDDEKKDEKKE